VIQASNTSTLQRLVLILVVSSVTGCATTPAKHRDGHVRRSGAYIRESNLSRQIQAESTAEDIAPRRAILASYFSAGYQDPEQAQSGDEAVAGADAAAEMDVTALAKQAQNPIANMISLPFENNFNFGMGGSSKAQYVLNVQPVIPFTLNDDWLLVTRSIIPFIAQPEIKPDSRGDDDTGDFFLSGFNSAEGLGDINLTAFFVPNKPMDFTWGIGPALRFPTATDDSLGSEKWSAGPSFVGLTFQGDWVLGILIQQVWSFAGDSDRSSVNQFFLQPFINYNLEDGWYLSSRPAFVGNWNSNDWTVPLGAGIGKIVDIGGQKVNLRFESYYNVVTPDNAADWTLKFNVTLLFPKG
jgi:hypothetical protein